MKSQQAPIRYCTLIKILIEKNKTEWLNFKNEKLLMILFYNPEEWIKKTEFAWKRYQKLYFAHLFIYRMDVIHNQLNGNGYTNECSNND